ncbi:hypothetical protein H632_c541p0 [Helicosporidium sp. ATCC 50920]|nr:hypothetical protein H632_c541p0 [Helicosporidium sp. ATCC 50920]|eukprot:KDD75703.1 hypothetical protein H632_c541p0 [Helicosporidium sp. ATCC 50920]
MYLPQPAQAAIDEGLDITITPRLRNWKDLETLSNIGDANTLEFSPTTKYGNHSYVDAVLFPIADAVREVATAKTKVEVTLALKAGASLFFYPSDWQVAKTQMQQRFLLLGSKLSPDNIKFGMGLSSKNICGCMGSEADNSGYLNSTKEWKKKLFDNRNTITSLLSSFNYLGVNGMILATPKYVKYDAMHLVQSDYLDGAGCTYDVTEAFVWNDYSWDVQDIYRKDNCTENQMSDRDPCMNWADESIITLIAQLNEKNRECADVPERRATASPALELGD